MDSFLTLFYIRESLTVNWLQHQGNLASMGHGLLECVPHCEGIQMVTVLKGGIDIEQNHYSH
ncbi:hypothetical protein MCEMRE26_00139 [Candidatus Nanopelagicaceae bacterium]